MRTTARWPYLHRMLVALAAVALLAPALARAQQAPEPETATEVPDPRPLPPAGLETITITDERETTDVQDEAQAITAFTGDDLDRASIVNVDSLAYSVPGLHVGQSGQSAIITLRGIGTENASLTGEPGVAFHVEGVNYARPAAARVAFFDLETLDVKRGPQGLLGGKNSTSGSINLVSKKPHDEYEIDGDVLFGNYDRVRMRGALNLPLTFLGEDRSARLAVYREDRDGFLDNKSLGDSRDPFDADDFGLRGHVRLDPSESLDLLISYNYFKQMGNGPQADIVPVLNPDPCRIGANAGRGPTVLPGGAACYETPLVQTLKIVDGRPVIEVTGGEPRPGIEDDDPRATYVEFPSAQDNRYWGWTVKAGWDVPELPVLGETRLEGIGGFQRLELDFRQDFDGTSVPAVLLFQDDAASQHTAELKWHGTALDRLDWQGGLYFARETGRRDLQVPDLLGRDEGLVGIVTDQTTENKAYGAMLHGELGITEDVRLQLGGRWIKDRKRNRFLRERPIGGSGSNDDWFRGCTGQLGAENLTDADGNLVVINGRTPKVPARENEECSRTDRGRTWGATLDWKPFGSEDHLLYAGIDRGFKSGGFNAGNFGEYLPERIWAYKLGTKSSFLDQTLQVNLEGFFYAYQDMQLVLVNGLELRTENVDTRMYGVDLEAKATPISGLNLSVLVSHLNTEVLDYLSLDPAALDNPTQAARLEQRELAEVEGGLPFDQRACQVAPCSSLGEVGPFDDFSGNELSRSPEWKTTLSAEYEISLGSLGTLIPRIQYTWEDEAYFRVFNRSFDLQDDYHQTDAKLTWNSPEDIWSVEVFVQNIEDEAPKQNILVSSRIFGSPPLAWYGPPRFYGIQVGFRY